MVQSYNIFLKHNHFCTKIFHNKTKNSPKLDTLVLASGRFYPLFYCIGLNGLSRTFFIASDFHGLLRTFIVVRVRPLQIYFCVYLRFLRDLKKFDLYG
jgi:hypothetical protein